MQQVDNSPLAEKSEMKNSQSYDSKDWWKEIERKSQGYSFTQRKNEECDNESVEEVTKDNVTNIKIKEKVNSKEQISTKGCRSTWYIGGKENMSKSISLDLNRDTYVDTQIIEEQQSIQHIEGNKGE